MLKIRFARGGAKKSPFYRIVVAEALAPRDGKFCEKIGFFNPMTKQLKLSKERYDYWTNVGARPTEAVERLYSKLH